MSAESFIAYYRVSTSEQGRSGLGLDAQRAAVAAYLNGGKWKIIEEYTEVESGKRADRPQLDAALKAARIRRAPLVVAKVDRLTRSVGFLSRLLEAGVDVRFADLPQIQGPTGRFMLQQMASVAELEGEWPISAKDIAQDKSLPELSPQELHLTGLVTTDAVADVLPEGRVTDPMVASHRSKPVTDPVLARLGNDHILPLSTKQAEAPCRSAQMRP